ncbi:T9SS type A sorting domain-containing protein [candidate division KSB1 bacterium]|nr:T9SS type A sorting domain-containing protein [candidate division KSB1 bacterium]
MKACNIKKSITLLLFALFFLLFEFSALLSQAVKLAWSLPQNPYISHTLLYRKSYIEIKFTLLAKINYPDSTFLDRSIKFDKQYYYYATAVDKYGNESDKSNLVDTLIISVAQPHFFIYPNPFNDIITIYLSLQQPEDVEINIYNVLGQKVRQLFKEYIEDGIYEIQWDGMDDKNVALATGLYCCQLQLSNLIYTKKMVLIR